VFFGRLFLANPDPVERSRENAPLNLLIGQETFMAAAPTAIPTIPPSRHAATDAGELALA
jgi:hypothetical protein